MCFNLQDKTFPFKNQGKVTLSSNLNEKAKYWGGGNTILNCVLILSLQNQCHCHICRMMTSIYQKNFRNNEVDHCSFTLSPLL
jgi:hypothetical protein